MNGNIKIDNGNLIASQNIHKIHYVFSDTNWSLINITSFTSFNSYTFTKTSGTDLLIFYSSVFTISGYGDDDYEYRLRVTSTNTIYSDTYHIESNHGSNSAGVRGGNPTNIIWRTNDSTLRSATSCTLYFQLRDAGSDDPFSGDSYEWNVMEIFP